MKIPIVSDVRRTISTDYGVLKEDEGIAYRWVEQVKLFSPEGDGTIVNIKQVGDGRMVTSLPSLFWACL